MDKNRDQIFSKQNLLMYDSLNKKIKWKAYLPVGDWSVTLKWKPLLAFFQQNKNKK